MAVKPRSGVDNYKCTLVQSGTGNPTVDVATPKSMLAPVIVRSGTGTCTFTQAGMFPQGKVFPHVSVASYEVGAEVSGDLSRTSDDVLTLKVRDSAGNLTDDYTATVEIEVRS